MQAGSRFNPVYFVPTKENAVAITFDDGPTPGVTDVLLRTLDEYGAKATFFMVGDQARKHPDIAKMVSAAGHEIGIHSDRHKKGMREWTTEELTADFSAAADAVEQATGARPAIVRTPFGNLCQSIIEACGITSMKYVGWSLSVRDWQGHVGDKTEKLVGMSVPGSIVLFHDGGRVDENNVQRTNSLLTNLLKERKAQFVTASELERKWDDKLVADVCGKRLLGLSSRRSGSAVEAAAFFDPFDVMLGISYVIRCTADGSSSEGSVNIAPMSNVSDWCQTTIVESDWPAKTEVSSVLSATAQRTGGIKLNLGCKDHILPGWENTDTPDKAVNGIVPWQWNQKLPHGDGTVELILIQHCTNHCHTEDFESNFAEIKRVLKPGGKVLIKDADDRFYVWRKIGKRRGGGLIVSTTSEPQIVKILEKTGFSGIETDKYKLVDRYGPILNRVERLLDGNSFFIVEGTTPVE